MCTVGPIYYDPPKYIIPVSPITLKKRLWYSSVRQNYTGIWNVFMMAYTSAAVVLLLLVTNCRSRHVPGTAVVFRRGSTINKSV